MERGAGKKRNVCQDLYMLYAQHLGKQMCLSLVFWYFFTCFDIVSSVNGRGRETAWNVCEAFPEIRDVFVRLSLGSADIAHDD